MIYERDENDGKNGLNKSGGAVDALDDAEYSGSVISLIENGEAFIKRNCKMKWRKTANSREEMPEYSSFSFKKRVGQIIGSLTRANYHMFIIHNIFPPIHHDYDIYFLHLQTDLK